MTSRTGGICLSPGGVRTPHSCLTRLVFPRALRRALLRTLVPACLMAAAAFPAPAGAVSSDLEFPADGPAMQAAMWAGTVYWGKEPCGGNVDVTWATLTEDANAMSYWTTFSQDP